MFPSGGGSAGIIRSIKCEVSSSSSTNMQHAVSLRAGSSASPSTEALILKHEYEGQHTVHSIDKSSGEGPSRRREKQNPHRHTQTQISALEASFAECAYPNEERRKLLSERLGLTERQVKFWFQNKRNLVKSQKERLDNLNLKEENERFKEENIKMKHTLLTLCSTCLPPSELAFEGHRLMTENQIIKRQGLPIPNAMQIEDATKYAAANSAMIELTELMQYAEPLWIRSSDCLIQILNETEYIKYFSGIPLIQPRVPGLANYENTRATDIIMLDCLQITEIMMNPTNYTTFFPSLVSEANLVQVFCKPYQDNYHGTIQMMTMECQSPSPLVPLRKCSFLRYCQWNPDGFWAIVDISMTPQENQDIRTVRRPSGCILQEVSHNMTKVTWIEHVEVDDYSDTNTMYQQAVKSGIVFGARRWVSSLKQQSELVANINSTPINNAAQLDNKRYIFTVATKMIKTFFNGISGTHNDGWATYSGIGTEHDIKITSRINASDVGKPYDIVLCASASFCLAVPIQRAFEILLSEATHSELEALSFRGSNIVATSAQIARGLHHVDNISINHLAGGEISSKFLRQSFFDPMGAYIIYSPIKIARMQMIPIHPSGFVVIPNNISDHSKQIQPGSLVTVAYQIMLGTKNLDAHSIHPAAIAKVRELVVGSCRRIKASVSVPVNLELSVGSTVI